MATTKTSNHQSLPGTDRARWGAAWGAHLKLNRWSWRTGNVQLHHQRREGFFFLTWRVPACADGVVTMAKDFFNQPAGSGGSVGSFGTLNCGSGVATAKNSSLHVGGQRVFLGGTAGEHHPSPCWTGSRGAATMLVPAEP